MSPNRQRLERRGGPGVVTMVLDGRFDRGAVGNVATVLDTETVGTSAAAALDLSHLELIEAAGVDSSSRSLDDSPHGVAVSGSPP